MLKQHDCDITDVSAGQTVPYAKPVYGRQFQTPFSDRVRHDAGIYTMAVGNISSYDCYGARQTAHRAETGELSRQRLASGNPWGFCPTGLPGRSLASRQPCRASLAAVRRERTRSRSDLQCSSGSRLGVRVVGRAAQCRYVPGLSGPVLRGALPVPPRRFFSHRLEVFGRTPLSGTNLCPPAGVKTLLQELNI